MGWTLAAIVVGIGGVLLGAGIGVLSEQVGIWVMIASAVVCYFMASMNRRPAKKHKKDDD